MQREVETHTVDSLTRTRTDRTTELRDLMHGTLRSALRKASCADIAGSDVHAMIVRGCVAARESGLRIEELLVVLKSAWREMPETRHLLGHEADELLSSVITMCINEYYQRASGR